MLEGNSFILEILCPFYVQLEIKVYCLVRLELKLVWAFTRPVARVVKSLTTYALHTRKNYNKNIKIEEKLKSFENI
jgi:hypothetical protein